tara:strand:+ start:6337 stop:6444 length:108 start_codon:yes stop_codon:yes gene_type:complete
MNDFEKLLDAFFDPNDETEMDLDDLYLKYKRLKGI